MPNPRRKHVLLLVEGRSDAFALSRQLKQLLHQYDPSLILHTLLPRDGYSHDVTAESLNSPSSIEGVINSAFIHQFMDQYGLLPKDIVRVIHIVDMDGAYIKDGRVYPGEGRPSYERNGIYVENVDGIRKRNRSKQSNLDYLITLRHIMLTRNANDKRDSRKKSYAIYYFSSNLDHFLHGDANLPLEEKTGRARSFARACEADPDHFKKVFLEEEKTIIQKRSKETPLQKGKSDQYFGSWDYIKKGINSLQPHSNCVLIRELTNQTGCYLD